MGRRRKSGSTATLDMLPPELLDLIFSYVDWKDLCRLAQVCREWKELCDNHSTWTELLTSRGYPEIEGDRSAKQWFCHLQATALFVGDEPDDIVSTPTAGSSRHRSGSPASRAGHGGRGRFHTILSKLKRRLGKVPRAHTRHFHTLQNAVRCAHPKQRIIVLPGTYVGHTIIDHCPVRILGLVPPPAPSDIDVDVDVDAEIHVHGFPPDTGHVLSDNEGSDGLAPSAPSLTSLTSPRDDGPGAKAPAFRGPILTTDPQARGTAVVDIRVDGVSISNMHISLARQHRRTSTGSYAKNTLSALCFSNADACRLRNVHVTGRQGVDSITITGALSHVLLRSCYITGGASNVFVSSGSTLVARNSTFLQSKNSGIKCEGAKVIMTSCHLSDHKHGLVLLSASGKVEKCTIERISSLCIRISSASSSPLTIKSNTLSGGRNGCLVSSKAKPHITGNTFAHHTRVHLELRGEAYPVVKGNTFAAGARNALMVIESGGAFTKNHITGCRRPAIEIHRASVPILRNNVVENNLDCGILFSTQATGLCSHNRIIGNGKSGIQISDEADPAVRDNYIEGNQGPGILCTDDGEGRVSNNSITGNKGPGIEIQRSAKPLITRNVVSHGLDCGVLVIDGGAGEIKENSITHHARNGVEIQEGASPTLSGNIIQSNTETGVFIHNHGAGVVCDNLIVDNGKVAITLLKAIDTKIKSNIIALAKMGIYCGDGTKMTCRGNMIAHCSRTALAIAAGASVKVRGNAIHNCNSGIKVKRPSEVQISDNVFQEVKHCVSSGWDNEITAKFDIDKIYKGNREYFRDHIQALRDPGQLAQEWFVTSTGNVPREVVVIHGAQTARAAGHRSVKSQS